LFVRALEDRLVPATFTVINALDSGTGSLRDAITQANAAAGADTINFDPTFFGTVRTIPLASALPDISDSVTINGPGSGLLTILSNPAATFDAINVAGSTGSTIAISGLTIAGARSSGVAIVAGDDVSLTSVVVLNSADHGVAMNAGSGSLTLQGCTVSGNAGTYLGGGGVYACGLITVTLENTTISSNTATGIEGAGIFVLDVKTLVMDGCTVSGNVCTGTSGVYGGGLAVAGTIPDGVVIQDCTISGNSAFTGGGIYMNLATATLLVQNSTITRNTASSTTGLDGQGGGGISAKNNGVGTAVILESTIVAGNVNGGGPAPRPDLAASAMLVPIFADYCLIGVADTVTLANASGDNVFGTSATPLDPMLGPLAANGGLTQTCLPLPGSPAIDRGSNPGNLATDQRGNARVNGFAPDIGAVEVISPGLPVANAALLTTITTGGATSQQFTVTYQSGAPIAVSSLDSSDILVTGPNGFSTTATFVSVDTPTNGTPRTATYSFVPSGGAWSAADDGTYYLAVQLNQVVDTAGHSVPVNTIGSFQVLIAQTITVTTLADAGSGSLRNAITLANAFPVTADAIVFDPALFAGGPATISLLSPLPAITDSVTLTGPALVASQPQLTIRRDPTASTQFGVLRITAPTIVTVNLNNVTISGGAGVNGGGVYDTLATVNLTNVVVSGNNGGWGGGVYDRAGAMHLANCSVISNTGGRGGGLYVDRLGTLVLDACTVSGNVASSNAGNDGYGGGVYSAEYYSPLTLTDCVVSNNSAAVFGGGIGLRSLNLNLLNSVISGNSSGSGGGIGNKYGGYAFSIVGSTISANTASYAGGGINLTNAGPSNALIQDTTVAANIAPNGGGILTWDFYGTLLVQNCTVAANTATAASFTAGAGGGGICLSYYSANGGSANIQLQSTIIAGNAAANGRPDITVSGPASVPVSADHCLIGVADVGFTLAGSSANNLTGTLAAPLDPRLSPFENNGGTTPTLAPLPGSSVIDAGSNPAGLTTDQVGNPRSLGTGPDIGAVEHAPGVPLPTIASLPPVVTAPGGTSYQFSVTYYDDTAIDVSTLAGGNVQVTGPNGFSTTATLVGVDVSSNGSPRTATYSIVPPGGSWGASAVGTYAVSVRPNQVLNTAGVAAPAVTLGTFKVVTPLSLVVTTLADAGPGSLRDAISQANAMTPTADTITFDPALFAAGPGTISLISGLPIITDAVTITGPALVNGQPQLTIRRDPSVVLPMPVLAAHAPNSAGLSLSNLTIAGGNNGQSGGGVQIVGGSVTLTNVVVSGNSSTGYGGGIDDAGGVLTLLNCTVANNTGNRGGGGIHVSANGMLVMTGGVVSGNRLSLTGTGNQAGGGISVGAGSTMVLSNTSITGNSARTSGGGVYMGALSNITVSGCVVTGNSAGTGGGGISLRPGSNVTLTSTSMSGNSAHGSGGGVYEYGISSLGTTITVAGCAVVNNSAFGSGGGMSLGVGATTLLTNTSITGNSAHVSGGGMFSASVLTMTNCTVNGNSANSLGGFGGGISATGATTISGSTISGNTAGAGGGLAVTYGPATVRNSTFAANVARNGGGMVFSSAYVNSVIQNCTITGNTAAISQGAGGLAVISANPPSGGTVTVQLQSTIVAGNIAAIGRPDLSAVTTPVTFSLVADHCLIGAADTVTLGAGSGSNLTGTVASPLNPLLAPLGNYGGPTQTMPPLAGSLALNTGSNPAGLATDQRGQPRVVGPAPDIGAYEYVPITVAGVRVNDGSAQRSEVRSLTVTFSGPVSFAGGNGNAAAAFQLQHVQTGDNVNLAAAVSTNGAGQTVVILTFLSTTVNGVNDTDPLSAANGGQLSLADGRYQLIVSATAVSDAALGWGLDGDADGTPGGNFVTPAETSYSPTALHLYRLFGDATGDGVVDLSDLAAFRGTYNAGTGNPAYLAYLDADNSGVVDLTDLTEFRNRYNHSVFV
jgi:hypothetical protein